MKLIRTRHCLLCLFLLISLAACANSQRGIQGKWEATIASKRLGGGDSKVVYEFLPDGTYKATPPGDDTVVDKDKYQLVDEGRTLKFRSQFFNGEAVCKYIGEAIQCEADNAYINFKRL